VVFSAHPPPQRTFGVWNLKEKPCTSKLFSFKVMRR
jgi:hypothetical protein